MTTTEDTSPVVHLTFRLSITVMTTSVCATLPEYTTATLNASAMIFAVVPHDLTTEE